MFIEALNHFFDWEGRICRRQFLFLFILSIVAGCVLMSMLGNGSYGVILVGISLLLIPNYVKRLHDIGWSGWLIVLSFIPLAGMILFLLMLILGGTDGPNEYGPDPREPKKYTVPPVARKTVGQKQTSSAEEFQMLGDGLAEFILLATDKDVLVKSWQEKLEMRYLLLMETDRLLFLNFGKGREPIMAEVLKRVLLKSSTNEKTFKKVIDEYHKRIPVYMVCRELIGENGCQTGTRVFALSHFLQRARGKTTGKDMTSVIIGKRKLKAEDTPEFLDFFETIPLAVGVSQNVISIKNIIDKFKGK
ncbi:DUF805 domain-containing protein [Candidatus Avelusimicrobium stercoris]|uniref:DUF805 domain-containing protein n=1 Tax=Candidatus Avelusimicrobium stercoris TaxID=1947924 RepID=UPI003D0A78B8